MLSFFLTILFYKGLVFAKEGSRHPSQIFFLQVHNFLDISYQYCKLNTFLV